jgi:hypothetical protein
LVTKSKQKSAQKKEKGRVKVGKLQLNKETVKTLTSSERRKIKGGVREGDGGNFSRDAGCE